MKKCSKLDRAIREAAQRGYSVRSDGSVVSPSGVVRKCYVKNTSRSGYAHCTFNIRVGAEIIPVPAARFAAYMKFGERAICTPLVVRHRDDRSMNNRPSNLLLGTRRQNALDAIRNRRKRGA